jgi:hypothetical protein
MDYTSQCRGAKRMGDAGIPTIKINFHDEKAF